MQSVVNQRNRARWPIAVVDIGMLCYFTYRALPETVIPRIVAAGVPLETYIFIACLVFEGLYSLTTGSVKNSKTIVVASFGFYMLIVGIVLGNEIHFMRVDLAFFAGLGFGGLWTLNRTRARVLRCVTVLMHAIAACLLFNVVGLGLGFVPSQDSLLRVYTYSLFDSCYLVACFVPVVLISAENQYAKSSSGRATRSIAWVAIGVAVAAAVFASSRSSFFAALTGIGFAAWANRDKRSTVRLIGVIAASAAIVFVVRDATVGDTYLTKRLSSFHLAEEVRFIELQMMFDDLDGGYLLTGKGFGSRFPSNIAASKFDHGLALFPHIGILTLLQKGGIIAFVLLILRPILTSLLQLYRLATGRYVDQNDRLSLGANACVIVYMVQACLSAGWGTSDMIVFGASTMLVQQLQCKKTSDNAFRRQVPDSYIRGSIASF